MRSCQQRGEENIAQPLGLSEDSRYFFGLPVPALLAAAFFRSRRFFHFCLIFIRTRRCLLLLRAKAAPRVRVWKWLLIRLVRLGGKTCLFG